MVAKRAPGYVTRRCPGNPRWLPCTARGHPVLMEHDDETVRRAERDMEHDIDDLERHREQLDADIEESRRELDEMREVTGPPPGEA